MFAGFIFRGSQAAVCMQNMQAEMGILREKAETDRAKARAALASVVQVTDENKRLRAANPDAVTLLESSCAPPLPKHIPTHLALCLVGIQAHLEALCLRVIFLVVI